MFFFAALLVLLSLNLLMEMTLRSLAMAILLGLFLVTAGEVVRVLLSLDLLGVVVSAERVLLSLDEEEEVEFVALGLRDLVLFFGSGNSKTGFFLGGDFDLGMGESSRSSLLLKECRFLLIIRLLEEMEVGREKERKKRRRSAAIRTEYGSMGILIGWKLRWRR
ncbi:hypothetical protein M5K25_018432 [Dendrobium thyrsiflorum]|uniref:Uncharacterized protein n=1 Tax=Dendrobium thyrsiflorum TaxID=117978 RepID=A0ABD0UIM1_DENTH